MLHKDVLTISYKHHYKIRKTFKEILGLYDIEHFSLDLVRPDDQMLFFSGTPSHAYEICKRGYGEYDGIISPEYYKHFEFYWWKNAAHKAYADKIEAIRSGILGLKYGFMLVRHWNDFHLIYSFAAKSNKNGFRTNVINQINTFLKMGDWAYESMREIYAEYTDQYEPPKIERFYPFEGGKPPLHYTKDYLLNKKTLSLPQHYNDDQHRVIRVDFTTKKWK